MLNKIKAGAQLGHYRLVYFDEAGFAASPPVQYGWSPRGKPHETEPQDHNRRSVLGALNYPDNTLFYQTTSGSIRRADVIDFLLFTGQRIDFMNFTTVVLVLQP
ncbi:transposase [Xenorhabdus nematophila]|uniref:transposase n=1 Tax=Xenorhabdus nematophila TaxID=628 RepID=UPI001F2BDF0D|nr:transposase [Xenorhabdus nematophila]